MEQPEISVIITVYNQEKYIGKCIRSVTGQTFENFEIILVNDGSTDKSLTICQKYAQKDQRIAIINQPNSGLVLARKNGVLHAQGEYVFFVDGDDYVSSHALYKLMSLANKYNLDMVVGNHCRVCDNWGMISKKGFPYRKTNTQISKKELIEMWLGLGKDGKHSEGGVYLWGQLIRRTCILNAMREDSAHLFPSRCYMEDCIFHLAVAPYIKTCWLSNEIIYYYRIGGCTMHYYPFAKSAGGLYYDLRYEMCMKYHHPELLPFVFTHYKTALISDVAGQIRYRMAGMEEIRNSIYTELASRKIAIWAQKTHYDELKVDDIISSSNMQNNNMQMHFLRNRLIMLYQKIVDGISFIIES